MFFTRFRFTISYRPGSLNTKADALSRLYDTEDRSINPIPIIPAARLVAPVVWEVDADNERALRGELRLHSARRVCTQSQEEFKLEDLKKLEIIINSILTYNRDFAFDVQPVPLRRILAPGEEENLEVEEEEDAATGAGSPESFPNRVPGAAIFFEFKHYKPKKGFTSTKCFAFMEMDEIKPGPIVIELYKKPTDFKRKKLQLLTKKPLYLYLHQTLHKD
ncbi:axin interactor, dorsalization-associated protein-like [Salvelinus namaycush]|uniref:Axin interactor, dorsalization-associated protein-like n=1 Tax=Salvelinus namaycush TaxID=8040 RepID=A0A8U0QA50_SALNM|nr:axin interactor, dorsalization-associated protein-like [Salvelinus namaycush]